MILGRLSDLEYRQQIIVCFCSSSEAIQIAHVVVAQSGRAKYVAGSNPAHLTLKFSVLAIPCKI